MPAERMNVGERYKYLRIKQERYRKANRAERSRLLDERQGVTGLHRKSLIRLMAASCSVTSAAVNPVWSMALRWSMSSPRYGRC